MVLTTSAVAQTVTVAAAGDVACSPDGDPNFDGGAGDEDHCQMAATAALIENRDVDAVIAVGDIQYSTGRLAAYQGSYDATWGNFKDKTYPVPGNHDYNTDGAAGYYDYFGDRAGKRGKGYYSYDLGAWHIVALNSNCDEVKGCSASSKQGKWLKADLKAHPSACLLAYWHHPRFSSGYHGSSSVYQDFWDILYKAGADVVLAGHDHDYERFALQRPDGRADAKRGIREFVVGSGGVELKPAATKEANSEKFLSQFGVLFLNLSKDSYTWSFDSLSGKPLDKGKEECG